MADATVIAQNKIGKGLVNNQQTNLLDVGLSGDSGNALTFGFDNGLYYKTPDAHGITWVDATLLAGFANYFTSNNPTTPTQLQIGKDASGFIWLKGAFYNSSGASAAANSYFCEVPPAYFIAGYPPSTSLYQLTNCPVNIVAAGNTTVAYLKIQFYQNRQRFAVSAAIAANMCLTIPPQVIGFGVD